MKPSGNPDQKKDEEEEDYLILTRFGEPSTREEAFTDLVKKYQERLYWQVRRMVLDHDDTHDILQEIFIKVWRNLDRFQRKSSLFTWLYRIATNETLSWIDRQKRRATVPWDGEEAGFFHSRLVAQKGFDARKLEWKLQEAITRLPEKQRLVFQLRYYEEMPYDQMAEILETSTGSLKASYHHAVKKVEDYIKKSDIVSGE